MGWNSQSTRAITFDHVKVPAHCLLAQEGEGFKLAMKGLVGGRINIATCSVGAAQGAMNVAREYMRGRKQFNKDLTQFQALQFKYADMATQVVAARQMDEPIFVLILRQSAHPQHPRPFLSHPFDNADRGSLAIRLGIGRGRADDEAALAPIAGVHGDA